MYTQLLEFYIAATRFFTHGKMVLRLMSEALNDRLPSIIKEFLFHAGLLHQSIDAAAAKLTADISRLLLDNKSMIPSRDSPSSEAPKNPPYALHAEMMTSCKQSETSSGSKKKRRGAGLIAVYKRRGQTGPALG